MKTRKACITVLPLAIALGSFCFATLGNGSFLSSSELGQIAGGARCEQPGPPLGLNWLACNQCDNYVTCSSSFLGSDCTAFTNAYACVYCTVHLQLCGGDRITYTNNGSLGNGSGSCWGPTTTTVDGCNRRFRFSTYDTCTGTCP